MAYLKLYNKRILEILSSLAEKWCLICLYENVFKMDIV